MHRPSLRFLALLPALLGLFAFANPAAAQTTLVSGLGGAAGYGTECLSPNDDGSSDPVDLRPAFPAGLHFYSGTYTAAYVNTNGNITFNDALSVYTPRAFPIASQPMIAPYWADVDIRPYPGCGGYGSSTGSPGNGRCLNPRDNGVWWHLEPGRMIVTWDRVGYFACHGDRLMSFQLILTDASACGGPGDFDVEFRYNRCDWTTGDASGGSGGFGGTPAQAGFDAGDNVNFTAIPGSLAPDINRQLCTLSNVGERAVWHYGIRSGVITTDAGTRTCGVGACERVVARCANGFPLPCNPGTPTTEVCNGIDDDCNGMTDEGMQMCGRGACLRTSPLCENGHRATCVPAPAQTEICDNGIDEDCDGLIDDGCGTDVAGVDASDAPVDVCRDPRCLRLEGRAGPLGNCACRAPGSAPLRRGTSTLAWSVAALALAATRRRGRVGSRGPR